MGLISKQPQRIYNLIIGYQLQVVAQLNILKWFMDLPGCFKRFHHLAIPWHPHLRGRALGQWKEAKVPCWCRVISHPAGGSVSRLSSLVNDYNLTQYRPVDGWNLAGDVCCFKDPFSGLDCDGMMTCDLCLLTAGTGPKHLNYDRANKDKEAICSLHLLNLVNSLKVEISEFIIFNFVSVWDLCWFGMLNTGSWRATCVNALHFIQSWVASWSLGRSDVFWINNPCWWYGVLWCLWLSRPLWKVPFDAGVASVLCTFCQEWGTRIAAGGVVMGHWMMSAVEKWLKRWQYFVRPRSHDKC